MGLPMSVELCRQLGSTVDNEYQKLYPNLHQLGNV